ncbi:SGNH/GDSL hydrolase family protein [Cecembia calidifontis]|uniref:Lysophospholipase L1-like esterase n=1 Tax=Cecembia calidifontis TaxID=1187080 RepID=A0A4Q7PAE6_9BACT|nr:SGNH/GDSL hydrolase family protein [Cecembia calidifontis]RZS97233.1 lysophospholipase L1-like esterase [Cecembia calidifontis]
MILNRILYFFELVILIPIFPLLYFYGKKLRQKIGKLPPHSEFLALKNKQNTANLLIIGESTAAGVGASRKEKTYAYQIHQLLQEDFSVYNLGKNGLKADRLKRLLVHGKQELPSGFHSAIVLIGANDCFKFTPPSKFRRELKDFFHLLERTYKIGKIIVPSIPPVNQVPALPGIIRFFLGWHRIMLVREINSLLKENKKLVYLPINPKFPKEFFAADGIHPSDHGYQKMAEKVVESIKL